MQKSLICKETAASKGARSDDNWDPEWKEYTFTAWAECRHPACKQRFAIAGTGGVETDQDENGAIGWANYFSPKACYPMPDMFEFPAKCPDDVKGELRAAFAMFWAHRRACAGRVRVALEYLMNHLGVPKRRKNKNGKYFDLTLHARIDTFAANDSTIGPQLMALKWLGNAGNHTGEVNQEDLLDAFEIIEHALGEIIDKRSARVARLAKKLMKRHGH